MKGGEHLGYLRLLAMQAVKQPKIPPTEPSTLILSKINPFKPKTVVTSRDKLIKAIGFLKSDSLITHIHNLGLNIFSINSMKNNPTLDLGETSTQQSTFYDDSSRLTSPLSETTLQIQHATINNPLFDASCHDKFATQVLVKKLHPSTKLPTSKTKGSIGFDLITPTNITLTPDTTTVVSTSISCAISSGLYLHLACWSSLAVSHLLVGWGIIHNDYCGERKIILRNHSNTPIFLRKDSSIAQVIFEYAAKPAIILA